MFRPVSAWSVGAIFLAALVAWGVELIRHPSVLRYQENLFIWLSLIVGLVVASLLSLLVTWGLERFLRRWEWWQEALGWALLAVLGSSFSVLRAGGADTMLIYLLVGHLVTALAVNAWTVLMAQIRARLRHSMLNLLLWVLGAGILIRSTVQILA